MAVPFFRLLLLRLQVLILPYYICDARTGFLRVEVMMTYDEGLRVVLVQCFEQSAERSFLRLSARVGGLTASIIATFIAHANGVAVVVQAVGAYHVFRTTSLYLSVTADNVVVADAEVESSLAMPRIYLGCRTGLVRAHCRTVNHYQGYLPHDCTNRAELMAVNTVMAKLIIAFQFNFFIISSLYLSLLTHHSSLKAELESQLSALHSPWLPRR